MRMFQFSKCAFILIYAHTPRCDEALLDIMASYTSFESVCWVQSDLEYLQPMESYYVFNFQHCATPLQRSTRSDFQVPDLMYQIRVMARLNLTPEDVKRFCRCFYIHHFNFRCKNRSSIVAGQEKIYLKGVLPSSIWNGTAPGAINLFLPFSCQTG